ncbi:MAG: hypothetical protein DYG91_00490 [Chloroflexi bacterium CFX7]|nr:hypothetical protein [Chloroflexi bacterium CFX7]MCL4231863.1 hypothetical protein [Dehalococcoidia bacterium]RIL03380.1 MAG: hypothetical protein DCC78_04965 [bacterium]
MKNVIGHHWLVRDAAKKGPACLLRPAHRIDIVDVHFEPNRETTSCLVYRRGAFRSNSGWKRVLDCDLLWWW